jgi:hypothetical protein
LGLISCLLSCYEDLKSFVLIAVIWLDVSFPFWKLQKSRWVPLCWRGDTWRLLVGGWCQFLIGRYVKREFLFINLCSFSS